MPPDATGLLAASGGTKGSDLQGEPFQKREASLQNTAGSYTNEHLVLGTGSSSGVHSVTIMVIVAEVVV
jgi:hypothetical protein